ncbi:Plasmodium vivax Vir protein, putative [Plasmodium vivax]|nr:Plasmodium vivax Vir protein, putative [Plasmodium vivax]
MPEILDENKLSLLPTKKFYDQLDNAVNSCQGNTFYNESQSILNHYKVLQIGSDKILKGLCYVYEKKFRDESNNDFCNFLYYWLGNILYDNLIPRINLGSVISNLFVILRNHNVKNCTTPTNYNIYQEKHFNDIKLFFDYSKDYDTYEKQVTSNNMPCNEKYKKYLQIYVETYKKVQSECQNKSPPGYCNAFKEYFAEKDPTNLSKLTCNLQQNKAEAGKVDRELDAKEQQPSTNHGAQGPNVTLPGGFQGGIEQVAEGRVSSDQLPSKGTPELSSDSGPADVSPISKTTKTIATTASVAGILVPPFLVYNVISITIVKLIVLFYI